MYLQKKVNFFMFKFKQEQFTKECRNLHFYLQREWMAKIRIYVDRFPCVAMYKGLTRRIRLAYLFPVRRAGILTRVVFVVRVDAICSSISVSRTSVPTFRPCIFENPFFRPLPSTSLIPFRDSIIATVNSSLTVASP